ncbi:MAG: glutamate ligase domain-containing protein [Bacteroidota bacterium]
MDKKERIRASAARDHLLARRMKIRSGQQPAEHHLELYASLKGVDYINDSKSCDLDSAWLSLEKIPKPIIWILGGTSRDNDYAQMCGIVGEKAHTLICMGKDSIQIFNDLHLYAKLILQAQDINEAVKIASMVSQKGDAILFSPACPSYDAYANYEDRGRQFKAAVDKIEWGGI